jgi:septum site-determining protein MinD
MSRIVHIIGNSGSGKSMLALNLGVALSQRGKDVLLVDGNIYSPDIANYADISPNVFLNEYLNGEKDIEEVITHHPSGMKIIVSMPEEKHDKEKHEKINEALLSLVGKAELILVDSFSSVPAFSYLLDCADDSLYITNDDYPSIVKSKDIINKLDNKGIKVLGVVLNRKRKAKENVESILGKKVIASIPHDNKIIDSINLKQPIFTMYPKAKCSKAIEELANMLDID